MFPWRFLPPIDGWLFPKAMRVNTRIMTHCLTGTRCFCTYLSGERPKPQLGERYACPFWAESGGLRTGYSSWLTPEHAAYAQPRTYGASVSTCP